MSRHRCVGIILVTLTALQGSGFAQESDEGIPALRDIVSFYAPFVFPKIFQDTFLLRAFVRDAAFAEYRAEHGDLMAVDRLYEESLGHTMGNRYEALLICTFAVMDHRRVGVHLPLIGLVLWFPLSSEFQDEFDDRITRLPVRLYPDTPPTATGDRDKLQHFFGSAFLAFVSESRSGADRIGTMIEDGEEQFIIEGRSDPRDIRANQHGRAFGLALLGRRDVAPSDFLQLQTAEGPSVEVPKQSDWGSDQWGCVPGADALWEER